MKQASTGALAIGGIILSGFYYILPRMTLRIYPTCIKIVLSGGLIVNSICRSKSRAGMEKSANVIYNLFRGFARTASNFLLGPLPVTNGEIGHGGNIGKRN